MTEQDKKYRDLLVKYELALFTLEVISSYPNVTPVNHITNKVKVMLEKLLKMENENEKSS